MDPVLDGVVQSYSRGPLWHHRYQRVSPLDVSPGGGRHEFNRDLRHGYAVETLDDEDVADSLGRSGI